MISRIIYASKNGGLSELGALVRDTINEIIGRLAQRNHVDPKHIYKATVAGNTTMMHLFLGLPPASIRLAPFIPTVNHPAAAAGRRSSASPFTRRRRWTACRAWPATSARTSPPACLRPGWPEAEALTLFIDVGTNGEIVLGNKDWLVTCACSAGPAFEGAGVVYGMRATRGAIEEVWINSQTFEPTYRVIGDGKPRGICGSGLISLVAEMFITGVVDKGGKFKLELGTPRVREGEHGPEYVVAWASETDSGRDIVLTKVDVDNLLRAKAAIYAGFTVLAQSVGVDLAGVERVLIGGVVRQVHQRREGGADRPAARYAVGSLPVPGQHLGDGRVHGAAVARGAGADQSHRPEDDVHRAVGGQHLLRRVHVRAVPAAHRCEQVPVGGSPDGFLKTP